MECKGYIRVLKRTGENGSRCPVMGKCIIGTALNCDMRINLKGVASEHCKIFVDNAGQGIIENLTAQCPTLLNGSSLRLGQKEKLGHGDLFTVSDRTFRWEYLASSPFCVQSSRVELPSLDTSAPKKTVSVPFVSLRHTPSTNRIAVVTPVRREDSTPIDNKIEKLKKSSIPVKKFYRHSIQGSETFKKKSASRRSCAPNLVGTSVAKKLESGLPAATPQSYTSRKSRLFEIVQDMDVVTSIKEIKKSSRKSVFPNSPAKGKKSIGKKSFVQLPEVSRTPTRKSIKGQLVVESMEVSPESQSSGKESTKKGRKSIKNVSNSNNEAADKMLLQRTPKVDSGGADKKNVFKSRLKTPKKRVLETPGSVQQNAKRLKLTPNVESNEGRQAPSSRGKSVSKAVKKPLFSEMVKKNANIIRKRIIVQNAGKPVQMKLVRTKLQPSSTVPARLKTNSTGHAESPETIVIRKIIGTPRSTLKRKSFSAKGKQTPLQKGVTPKSKQTPLRKAVTPKGKQTPLRKAVTPKGKQTPLRKAVTPKDKPTPQRRAVTPKDKPTPQRKAVTPKDKLTPLRKSVTPKGKPTPLRRAATPKGKTTPLGKAVTPKGKTTPLQKATTPKDKSTPQQKAAISIGKPTPQRKAATPKKKSTPQRKAATPKDKSTPQQKAATPKSKPSPLRRAASPKDKSPLLKTAPPKDESTPQRQAATPKDKSTTQQKAATPMSKPTPLRKAATPKKKSTPQRKAATPEGKPTPLSRAATPKDKSPRPKASPPKDKSSLQRKAATPKSEAIPQLKAVTPKSIPSPQFKAVTLKSILSPEGKSPKSSQTFQRKSATPKSKQAPQSKSATPKSKQTPQSKSATPKGRQTPQSKSPTPKGKQTPQSKSATPKSKQTPQSKSVTPKDTSSRTVLVKDIRVSTGKLAAMRQSRSSRSKGTPVTENKLNAGKMTPNTSRNSIGRPTPTKTNASLKPTPRKEIKPSTTRKTPEKERPASAAKKTPSSEIQSPHENLAALGQNRMLSGKKSSGKNSVSPVKRSSQVLNTSIEKRTPTRLASILSSPLEPLSSTGRSSRKRSATRENEKIQLSHEKKKTRVSAIDSPDVFSITNSSFDFGAIKTPQVPQETFVSPLSSRTTPNTSRSTDLNLQFLSSEQVLQKSGGRKSVKKTPREKSSYSDVGKSPYETSKILKAKDIRHIVRTPGRHSTPKKILGRKSTLTTPESQRSLRIKSISAHHSATPVVPTFNVQGLESTELDVKKQSRTAKVQKSPKNDLSDFQGLKKLMRTPKLQLSPKNDLSNVHGVKKLLRTPKSQKSPKNDLNDVKGIKKLLATPKIQKSPRNDLSDVRGVKKLLASPKVEKSPRNDLSDVRGVKKLLASPKVQKSPRNDLSDVRGVKKLLASPKVQKSPKNDLTDVRGVKKLISTPKVQASPRNDLTNVRGVKKLLGTPRTQKSPKNDLTDVRGVRKLLTSPKILRSPKNDLSNVQGVKQIFRSPKVQKSPKNDLTNVSGLKNLFDVSIEESKNIKGTPLRTKGVSSSAKSSRKKTTVAEVVERSTRSRRKIDVQSPATSPKLKNKIEKSPLSLPADNVPSPKKLRKVAKSSDESTKNADASNNSVSKKAIAEIHDKIEENLTPNQKGRSRNTRAKKRSAEVVAVDSQSCDVDVTPPKTRRTRKNTGSESQSEHTSDVTSVSEKSLVSKTPPKTRHGKNKSVAPGRTVTHRDRNISESSSAGSPATSKSADAESTSLSKNSPSKTRGRTKSILPPLLEKESRSHARKSPKATRGKTKSVVVHISEENENTSELSSPRIVEVDKSSAGNKKSPLKTRGRTKPSGISTPVKESSPVRKSSPKGRRGRSNQSKSSATTEEPLQQVNNIEVKSALASPQKKQTRSRKGESKTVKFHESVVAAPEIQPSEKIPNKRSRVTAEEDVKEVPEKQSGKQSKKAVATRSTRTKKVNLEVTETAEENDSENVRATRSTRRKKT